MPADIRSTRVLRRESTDRKNYDWRAVLCRRDKELFLSACGEVCLCRMFKVAVCILALVVFCAWAFSLVFVLSLLASSQQQIPQGLPRLDDYNDDLTTTATVSSSSAGAKLAFLFLARSSIPTAPIWEAFFADDPLKELYSIYSHPRPGFRLSGIFAKTEIVNRTKVTWGAVTVAKAEMLLVRAALSDRRNERFLLVSESCVPVHPLRCVYDFAMTSPSMVATWKTLERRSMYDFGALDALVKRRWRKGHQWVLLARREALLVADEEWYDAFFEAHAATPVAAEFRSKYTAQTGRYDGDSIHHSFADEHFVQTAIAVRGLEADLVAASPTYLSFGSPQQEYRRRRRLLELDISKPMQRDWRAASFEPRHIGPALLDKARAFCLYDQRSPRRSVDDDARTYFPALGVAPWDTRNRRPECLFDSSRPSLCHLTLRKIPNHTVSAYLHALWPHAQS